MECASYSSSLNAASSHRDIEHFKRHSTGVRERVLQPRATLVLVLQRMEIMNV